MDDERASAGRTVAGRISIAALVGEAVDLLGAGDRLRGGCSAHRERERGLFVDDAMGLSLFYARR